MKRIILITFYAAVALLAITVFVSLICWIRFVAHHIDGVSVHFTL